MMVQYNKNTGTSITGKQTYLKFKTSHYIRSSRRSTASVQSRCAACTENIKSILKTSHDPSLLQGEKSEVFCQSAGAGNVCE